MRPIHPPVHEAIRHRCDVVSLSVPVTLQVRLIRNTQRRLDRALPRRLSGTSPRHLIGTPLWRLKKT